MFGLPFFSRALSFHRRIFFHESGFLTETVPLPRCSSNWRFSHQNRIPFCMIPAHESCFVVLSTPNRLSPDSSMFVSPLPLCIFQNNADHCFESLVQCSLSSIHCATSRSSCLPVLSLIVGPDKLWPPSSSFSHCHWHANLAPFSTLVPLCSPFLF